MGKFSRNKGKAGEREFANIMKDWLGGLGRTIARRIEQTRDSGHDLDGLEPFAVEVKRQETLSVPAWWRQAKKSADVAGLRPALAYRRNGEAWRVMVELTPEEFATVIRECEK